MLALIAIEGERSGYDLLKQVKRAIGYVWAPARSQLYVLLPRLVKDGLAVSRAVAQSDRPDKTLYRISADGRRALDAWLETDPDDRDGFHLRLFVGALTTDEVLIRHAEAFRDKLESKLEELRAIEPTNRRREADYLPLPPAALRHPARRARARVGGLGASIAEAHSPVTRRGALVGPPAQRGSLSGRRRAAARRGARR